MLSRVAENLYWLARYVERAENTARLINVNLHLELDLPRKFRPGWRPLIEITGNEEAFAETRAEATEAEVLRFLTAGDGRSGSILGALARARENARTLREILPREAWEQVNRLYLGTHGDAEQLARPGLRQEYLSRVIGGAQCLTGLLAGTMTHDEGYDFLRIGRNLERADMTSRILDVRSANLLEGTGETLTPFDNIQWASVLKSMSAHQMYRREGYGPVRRRLVLAFLLQNPRFPRSFRHCVATVQGCLSGLPPRPEVQAVAKRLLEAVLTERLDTLAQDRLHRFMDELQLGLSELHDRIQAAYFSLSRDTLPESRGHPTGDNPSAIPAPPPLSPIATQSQTQSGAQTQGGAQTQSRA